MFDNGLIMESLCVSLTDAKSQEAAQAYYDPNQPQTAYVPPPPAYYVSTFGLCAEMR